MYKPKKKPETEKTRRNPIVMNEQFVCEKCGKPNPPAKQSCRNHCSFCLYSKHVDLEVPGDRKSECLGLMEPVYIEQKGKKGLQIVQQCLKCGKKIPNITAEDDDMDKIIVIMQRQNLTPFEDR